MFCYRYTVRARPGPVSGDNIISVRPCVVAPEPDLVLPLLYICSKTLHISHELDSLCYQPLFRTRYLYCETFENRSLNFQVIDASCTISFFSMTRSTGITSGSVYQCSKEHGRGGLCHHSIHSLTPQSIVLFDISPQRHSDRTVLSVGARRHSLRRPPCCRWVVSGTANKSICN